MDPWIKGYGTANECPEGAMDPDGEDALAATIDPGAGGGCE